MIQKLIKAANSMKHMNEKEFKKINFRRWNQTFNYFENHIVSSKFFPHLKFFLFLYYIEAKYTHGAQNTVVCKSRTT